MSRKPGRKPAFTRRDVTDAAFALGLDTFTLGQVAQRLGVGASALYRLFDSRDAIVQACLDVIAGTIARPAADAPWRDALQMWADEAWRVCETYPGLSRVLFSFPTATASIERIIRTYAVPLTRAGKTPGQILFAFDFVGDTVTASHLGVQMMRETDENGRRGMDRLTDAVAGSPFLTPEEGWTGEAFLRTKIAFILDSLEHTWPEAAS